MTSLPSSSKEIKLKETFQYGDKTIEYSLVKSKRRKTCEVIVDKDEITIRVPFDKPLNEVEQILNDKIKWISQKQKEIHIEKVEIVKPSYDDHSTLPYLGNNYPFEAHYIDIKRQRELIEFQKDKFLVYLDSKTGEKKERIKSLYNTWLISQANQIFEDKVSKYTKVIDVTPNRIVIKNLKNRWGSVTKNKTINLNVNLVKAPEDIIDYIIIHELCHFRVKGHSYRFWDYLKQFIPDFKQKVEWLRRNSVSLVS